MTKTKIARILTTTTVITGLILSGCSAPTSTSSNEPVSITDSETEVTSTALVMSNDEDGGHVIEVDGETAEYSDVTVTKTGDAEGDEADFYGDNSAIFATNKATLTLSNMNITTDGTHANAVFSYGEGTTVNISDSTIETSGNCSGGIMTTGGGTTNASNLKIHTTGNSSAAIRSDRGGGTVTVDGGDYTTAGVGSPVIYSTADITVNDATLTSTASEGVVVEGKNSVTLNGVILNVNNDQHNSDKSDIYKAIMIYQSMSGDADTGLSEFSANDSSIINENGDIFFVTNTATDISLKNVEIKNNGDGVFLRAAAAGWGNDGSNGGKVNLAASEQDINGDMIIDDVSAMNLYMKDNSTFTGSINPDGAAGDVYVDLSGGSKWVLTGDSYISSLTCDADSIDLNGFTLYIDGKEYASGTASTGEAIEISTNEGGRGGDMQAPPDGNMQKPDGEMGAPSDGEMPTPPDGEMSTPPDGEMPTPPDGNGPPQGGNGMQPPEKPSGEQ